MKILLINPNSSLEMTENIQQAARKVAAGHYEVDCKPVESAPLFLETYRDMQLASAGMVSLLQENMANYDAFVVACGYDPNLDLMKELATKPLVGAAEASMKMASMLGHRFTVLCTDEHSIPIKEDMARNYGLMQQLASVRVVALPDNAQSDTQLSKTLDAYAAVCRLAAAEDGAEVIVLSCSGFAGLDRRLTELCGLPVLDGISCGLVLAAGMAQCGLCISKARKYRGSEAPQSRMQGKERKTTK